MVYQQHQFDAQRLEAQIQKNPRVRFEKLMTIIGEPQVDVNARGESLIHAGVIKAASDRFVDLRTLKLDVLAQLKSREQHAQQQQRTQQEQARLAEIAATAPRPESMEEFNKEFRKVVRDAKKSTPITATMLGHQDMWVELRILHHYREKYGIVVTPEELGYGPGPGVPMGGQGISAEPDDDSNDEMEMDDEYSDDTLYQADAEMDAQLSERELNQQVADNESLEEEQDEEN